MVIMVKYEYKNVLFLCCCLLIFVFASLMKNFGDFFFQFSLQHIFLILFTMNNNRKESTLKQNTICVNANTVLLTVVIK